LHISSIHSLLLPYHFTGRFSSLSACECVNLFLVIFTLIHSTAAGRRRKKQRKVFSECLSKPSSVVSRADQTRIQTGRPMCVLSFVTQKTGHKENKLLSSPTKLCCSLTYLNLFFFSPPLLLARLSFLQRKQLMIKSDRNAMSFCELVPGNVN